MIDLFLLLLGLLIVSLSAVGMSNLRRFCRLVAEREGRLEELASRNDLNDVGENQFSVEMSDHLLLRRSVELGDSEVTAMGDPLRLDGLMTLLATGALIALIELFQEPVVHGV